MANHVMWHCSPMRCQILTAKRHKLMSSSESKRNFAGQHKTFFAVTVQVGFLSWHTIFV